MSGPFDPRIPLTHTRGKEKQRERNSLGVTEALSTERHTEANTQYSMESTHPNKQPTSILMWAGPACFLEDPCLGWDRGVGAACQSTPGQVCVGDSEGGLVGI